LAAQQRAEFMGQEFDQTFQSRVINATKFSEVANMRFTAAQQIAIENSHAVNTMNLSNLSNRQAIVMAEASTISQLEVTTLNNRQAAAQQNAQSFLDMDMSNLSNSQQATMFDAQAKVTAMLTDVAAENATKQFNATSKQQADQFFANLTTSVSTFNAGQLNAQAQFNAGETNTIAQFNEKQQNERDQFNSTNRLIIDQANVKWRRDVATAETAATNRANEINAQALIAQQAAATSNMWQKQADEAEQAFSAIESGKDRFTTLAAAKMSADTSITIANIEADYKTSVAAGKGIASLLFGGIEGTFVETIVDAL